MQLNTERESRYEENYSFAVGAFAVCFPLCLRQKRGVTNVEGLIDAIGEVSAESESAITAAEEAYNALTEEEKAEVENYAELTAACEVIKSEIAKIAIVGTWTSNGQDKLHINADGTFVIGEIEGTWEYVENSDACK